MKYAIKSLIVVCILFASAALAHADMRPELLRDYALKFGINDPAIQEETTEVLKVAAGKLLFESTSLSLNGDTSCRSCHLDEFSSADGIPNAVGVGGVGKGTERMRSAGAIIPRNTLPLWGRGTANFRVFFWDGKVERNTQGIVSQFGNSPPSDDPLTVAVHLPFVEIREMLRDDVEVDQAYKREDPIAALEIYDRLVERVRSTEKLAAALRRAYHINNDKIVFGHIAESVASFIRHNFRLRRTRLHEFVFGNGALTPEEIAGGILFYGKGRCALCHNGATFSDLKFYAIPFPQVGFGKNGFGIDYGRYNVTFDVNDSYKFRTPPLINVAETSPYSHSGAITSLPEAIRFHFDPLRDFEASNFTVTERHEFYKRLAVWASQPAIPNVLTDEEVAKIELFLRTLSFTVDSP